ncbi:MAG: FAD-dependent oxidoreductase [Pseudomonadota bacterium]|nr:FAD-dependent oxidoreductase [Pseudomonadota bacterium]
MARPAIFAIDDDPAVLRSVVRDLRLRYGEHYRILRAESGRDALESLKTMRLRSEPVALFMVDQRMPEMSGVEFLEQAMALYPAAKRVLLTAYADTDAAIRAINLVRLDYYLVKPWHPPEEHLYPVLDDLLADWEAGYRPPYGGVRLIDYRWSPQGHRLRDFLARNHIPYRWLDREHDAEARQLLDCAGCDRELPVLVLPDGRRLVRPELPELAAALGLATRSEAPSYDLVVVGAGPAGLAAGVYAASEGLRTALIEKAAPGGQAGTSSRIENYLGFPVGLSGADLSRRALTQARRFGVDVILTKEVTGLRLDGPYRHVGLDDGSEIGCQALIIATGVAYRRLQAQGIEGLEGAGVYYGAAMTEAITCQGQDVFVVGGANSAGQGAMFLAGHARTVTILYRGPGLAVSMSQYLIDQIGAVDNIHVRPNTIVTAVHGDRTLEGITVRDVHSGNEETLAAAALFVYIGAEPRTDWLAGVVERDERGYILTGPALTRGGRRPAGWSLDRDPFLTETSVPGVFAAGDVRGDSIKRVASAVGEGSITVAFVHQYLARG